MRSSLMRNGLQPNNRWKIAEPGSERYLQKQARRRNVAHQVRRIPMASQMTVIGTPSRATRPAPLEMTWASPNHHTSFVSGDRKRRDLDLR
jgi:hypothetical protein